MIPRLQRQPSGTPRAVSAAVREAARFDRSMVSFDGGLLAAIPVTAVLGGGIAAGDPVAGVTMGAGAMLVGIAWRTTGGRPPLALMATDALLMATSTFVGCVTGSVLWLHLIVLAIWSLIGGLLVGVGNRGGVLGTQMVLAAVVFGRFSEPVAAALGLAGLVLAGGFAQVVFLTLIRWPMPLRAQRAATAAAYRALAALAASGGEASTLPAGTAIDDASAALSSPTLLGDSALMTLRSIVNESARMRVQLAAIGSLRAQQRAAGQSDFAPMTLLDEAAEILALAADAIEGDSAAARELTRRRAELSSAVTGSHAIVRSAGERAAAAPSTAVAMSRRLASLAGQLRAVASLAPSAGEGGGLRSRRPQPRTGRPLQRLQSDLGQLRANISRHSPAGRHAVRLAVVVVIAELLARHVPLSRSYWMVVAAATVLRPEFGATFTRGTERAVGTLLGVILAGAIAVGLHPAGGATVVLVGLLAWAAYSVFPASFAAGFGFITAMVVFLLNAISPDTLATADARLLDTLVGGALGLIAYAVWPTWAEQSARQAQGALTDAQRTYLGSVLAAVIEGRRLQEHELRPLARRVRLARTQAESTVARSLSEPQMRRIDADQSRGALSALRRLVQASHVMRLDAEEDRPHRPLPALAPLAADLDRLLEIVQRSLAEGVPVAGAVAVAAAGDGAGAGPLPDLRAAYEAFEAVCPADDDGAALLAELDEIVDAANSLAAVMGLETVAPELAAGAPAQA